MAKSQEGRHGCATESTMFIHTADITATGRSAGIDGEQIGHLHGYRKNGGDLVSLACTEVVDPLALVDPLDLAVKVAAFSDAAT
jgi:hypothetical protein